MDSFELFFEKNFVGNMPLTRGSVMFSLGLDVPAQYWKALESFPSIFDDKLMISTLGLDDPRKEKVVHEFVGKCFSLAAAFIGYGKRGRGYSMPKTKVICDYRGLNVYKVTYDVGDSVMRSTEVFATDEKQAKQEGSAYGDVHEITPAYERRAQHSHYRKRSWSHLIEMFMDQIVGEPDNFQVFMSSLVHEMIHGKQTTTRRLSTSGATGGTKWDGIEYDDDMDAESFDFETYKSLPWEIEAHARSPEILKDILSYLRSGVATGFNPKTM